MGITIDEVVFRGDAPSAPTIAKMVEDISGLPLVLNDFGSEIRGSLFDLHARLAFARYPRCRVNLTAYRAGAVGEHVKQCVMDGLPIGITNAVEGANEAPGTQTVYVEGYTEERTIVGVTLLALEALGGRLREPISAAERQVYAVRSRLPSWIDVIEKIAGKLWARLRLFSHRYQFWL